MCYNFIVFIFFSLSWPFLHGTKISPRHKRRPATASLVGGRSNTNYQEYTQFIYGVLCSVDLEAFQTIKSNTKSDLFTVTEHNLILTKFTQHYANQLKAFPPREILVEESFAAYLKYVTKRNFDKSPGFALPSAHQLKVIKTFTDSFAQIALKVFQLKRSSFNEILFREITKDLGTRIKFLLLKEAVKICDPNAISSQSFILMLQSFIKICPETFLEVEKVVNLHTISGYSNWKKQIYFAPINFALLRIYPNLDSTRNLLKRFFSQKHSFNQQEIFRILDRILHSTNFLSRNHLFSVEEMEKRRQIVRWIVASMFPGMSLYELLTSLAQFDEILVFEMVLFYEKGHGLAISEMELITTLDYVILCTAARFSDIIYSSIIYSTKIEDILIKFDLELLLLTISYFPSPIKHKIVDNIAPMPETSPFAFSLVCDIADQLIDIVNTFPKISLSLKVSEDENDTIHLTEPSKIKQYSNDLIDRFPIYIYAARIFLFKVFSIPLAATRFLDSTNESALWSEAVAFINFYIERFAQISYIDHYYKVV